jgi:hypothetical protein
MDLTDNIQKYEQLLNGCKRRQAYLFFFTSWYRHWGLFRLRTLIPSLPRSDSVLPSGWFMLQNLFGYPIICRSTQMVYTAETVWVSYHLSFYPNGLYCRICLGVLSSVVLPKWFIRIYLCLSTLFCTDYIFSSIFFIPLIWSDLVHPLTVLNYFISPDSTLCKSLALIVQDSLLYRTDGSVTCL